MTYPYQNNFRLTDAFLIISWLCLAAFLAFNFWQDDRQAEKLDRKLLGQPTMKFTGPTTVHYYDNGTWNITPEVQPSISEVFKKKENNKVKK